MASFTDASAQKRFPTMFGPARSNCNVVFVIDTSGSMYNKLDSVKTHLIEHLLELALRDNVTFNIIEFSSDVRCWSDKMVVCSQSTVEVAIPWIKTLTPKTGTNTLDALTAAFDNDCDAVQLVTDGLPDQHPFDIMDEVVYASNQRPVHCIYLTGDRSDATAARFLENLAKETRGSFLMASIVRYGCVEKITPVYRTDHAGERLVRTMQGTYHPASNKFCSVTSTLSGDPLLPLYPAVVTSDGSFTWPYFYDPYWWTRYHSAKTFMRSAAKMGDSLVYSNMGVSPSAAVMLIGQKVVARRQDDGYYYPGTVNSQLSTEVFLIEFDSTKVGDYNETNYQDTAIYDIISFTDALRHPVIPGDRVLAPTTEGHYCPAIVIAGMEYRGTNSAGLDTPITVSFCDGKTRDLTQNSAIWIPSNLYDRISLEIRVPQKARKPLTAVEGYPMKTLPGYPRSGRINAVPMEYAKLYPSLIDCGDVLMDYTWFGWPRLVGLHTAMYKPRNAAPVSFKSTEIEAKAAESKPKEVAQDLVMAVKEVEPEKPVEEEEAAAAKPEEKTEDEEKINEDEYMRMLEDLCDNVDDRYKYPSRAKKPTTYVPWKTYWHADPIPDLIEPSRPGPFRDTALAVPMELRELRLNESGVENTDSQFSQTKSAWGPRRNETNLYRMTVLPKPGPTPVPHPPCSQPQAPSVEFTKNLGESQKKLEELESLKRNFRRRRIILREDERINNMLDGEKMNEIMRDRHRERVLEQMNRDRTRVEADRDAVNKLREVKRQLAAGRREVEFERGNKEHEQTVQRMDARRTAQVQRNELEIQRRAFAETKILEERAAKDARSQARWQQRHDQLEADERQRLLREAHLRGVKLGRRERYRLLEAQGQQNKELQATVFKDNQAVFQSAMSY